jgi:hypothetical protein
LKKCGEVKRLEERVVKNASSVCGRDVGSSARDGDQQWWRACEGLPYCSRRIEPAESRKLKIENHNVGAGLARTLDCMLAVEAHVNAQGHRRGHLQQPGQRLGGLSIIVAYQHTHFDLCPGQSSNLRARAGILRGKDTTGHAAR